MGGPYCLVGVEEGGHVAGGMAKVRHWWYVLRPAHSKEASDLETMFSEALGETSTVCP